MDGKPRNVYNTQDLQPDKTTEVTSYNGFPINNFDFHIKFG
jgi:hypothetical protein